MQKNWRLFCAAAMMGLLCGCVGDDLEVRYEAKHGTQVAAAAGAGDFVCPQSCDDDNMCTDDWCDAAEKWCDHTPVSVIFCRDANSCTYDERCDAGMCVAHKKFVCDDGNNCTEDHCNGDEGECWFPPIEGAACDDGDPCTTLDHCKGNMCVVQKLDCSDDDPSTFDYCSPTHGCVHVGS